MQLANCVNQFQASKNLGTNLAEAIQNASRWIRVVEGQGRMQHCVCH